jgi:hypothetical protein
MTNQPVQDHDMNDLDRKTFLFLLDKGSKIRVGDTLITFHKLDGAYSYCTDEEGNVHHLSVTTPLILGDDGVYSVIETPAP